MFVAGFPAQTGLFFSSPRLIDDPELAPAWRTVTARGHGARLAIAERETIIRTLDDPPPGLEELRRMLLAEHVGRLRKGLA